MNKKTIGIFVCIMFITIIPLSSGMVVETEYEPRGWCSLMGLVINPQFQDDMVRCFAIRLRYTYRELVNGYGGILSFDWVIFDKNVLFREWGKIHFVFRIYYGYFEIERDN